LEDEIIERVDEAIRVAGLPAIYYTEPLFFLSKGFRQRVAIASILALKPQVIIVDEPTTGQDARQSLEIMDFLQELNEEHGHTIIIITHDMPIVEKYARRVITIGQGYIVAAGTTRSVFTQSEVLQKTYLALPQITQLAQSAQTLGFYPGTLTVDEMVDQYAKISA
jgi:energy-coupling factor transport system ATP-binding protein